MKAVKRRSLIVRAKARKDVLAIADRVAIDSIEVADRLSASFADHFERLCASGGALRLRPEFGNSIRIANHQSWLIFFKATDSQIIILRVLHGAMHPKRLSAAAKSSSS
jgi:toxin ParE1/3/4